MKKIAMLFLLCVQLSGCATSKEPEFGEIDWYLSNGSGSGMTVVVYDKICARSFFRIDLPRTGQVGMTTCQDSAGRAAIRYRRAGRIAAGNPWMDTLMQPGQVLVVR